MFSQYLFTSLSLQGVGAGLALGVALCLCVYMCTYMHMNVSASTDDLHFALLSFVLIYPETARSLLFSSSLNRSVKSRTSI